MGVRSIQTAPVATRSPPARFAEGGVKQFNKRVKGTEQFWLPAGVEPILAVRESWVSQDDRWDRYWANRPAYAN